MRRLLVSALAISMLAGCAPQRDDIRNRPLGPNPTGFVAAEIAFARLAQEKGQWTAFRETSHADAVMFVPQRVKARDWLRSQKDPAEAVRWQPHAVYVSCDGNAAATTGAWQKGPAHGYFTTVWLRDARTGKTLWVLDHADELAVPREAPEYIASKQAVCGSRPGVAINAGAEGEDRVVGLSGDQTLSWTSAVRTDGSRRITIRLWDGSSMASVIDDSVAAKQP